MVSERSVVTTFSSVVCIFLCSLFMSCAGSMSGNQGTGGPFSISTTSSEIGKFYILSKRDTGLVVAPANASMQGFDISGAKFLHKDRIKVIKNFSLSGLDVTGTLVGIPVGGLVGALVGVGLVPEPKKPTNILDATTGFFTETSALGAAITGSFIGSVIGSFAGGLIFSPQSKFVLSNPDVKEKLVYLCKYCGSEPEVINNIK